MNNGLFNIGSIQTTPVVSVNPGILSSISSIYGPSPNRGVGVNYDNLVFLIDTRLESDNIFSFSFGTIADTFVDWGDGSREIFKTTGTKTHTYRSKGRYIIQIGGTLGSITFASMTGRGKLVSCLSFGNLARLSICTFNGCSNLISVPNQIPRTFTSLNNMFAVCIRFNDNSVCSWDTSNITDMAGTFSQASIFNRPLNSWNTKKVTSMGSMFGQSGFNQPIGSWDTSKVTTMANMFNQQYTNAFNQNIDQWNVSNVTNMSQMFYINKGMNYSLNNWNTSKVTTMVNMFYQSNYNADIGNWDVSSVTTMGSMFFQSPFNKNINNWNVGKVAVFTSMFNGSSFNGSLSGWASTLGTGVSTINMSAMFAASSFNQPIENWNISKVNNFSSMFSSNTVFNQSLSGWSTNLGSGAGITSMDMSFIFNGASAFNSSVDGWRFDKPTSMSNSFTNTTNFNHSSITGWQTSGINNMGNMFFNNRVFNQPIGSWDVRNVTTMANMFNFVTSFNQNLSGWNIAGLNAAGSLDGFMASVTLSTINYNNLLIDWNNNKASYRSDLRPNFGSSKYSASPSEAATARAALVTYGWTITDGGQI